MDVNAYRVVVHRDPRAGRYSSILAYGEGEEITSLAAPDYSFSVADAFGPTRV